jgi:hypothetical protein
MFAYSEDGQHFLGYRITSFGKVQVVYDCAGTKHKVFTVETPMFQEKSSVMQSKPQSEPSECYLH